MTTATTKLKPSVRWLEIGPEHAGQRLDNFLFSQLKGVPKTRIYRIVRKGEVRVNKGRVDAKYRLQLADSVRIPPLRVAEQGQAVIVQPSLRTWLIDNVLYEDPGLLVLNKPAGFAVHGGSGISSGVIEALRAIRDDIGYLELVHRLDKDTSGCLLVAKKSGVLRHLHAQFTDDRIEKNYLALLHGQLERKQVTVDVALKKNVLKSGERHVVVSRQGKPSRTVFTRLQRFDRATLVQAQPKTGRTHQIRVHAAWLGHPIIGDSRYSMEELDQNFQQAGFAGLFLHAERLQFEHPETGERMSVQAPLATNFQRLLEHEKKI